MIQYVCDGCGAEESEKVEHVGKDRHYCEKCLPSIRAFLGDLHDWLQNTAKAYRSRVKRCDEVLAEKLPDMKRAPVVDDILLRIEDR